MNNLAYFAPKIVRALNHEETWTEIVISFDGTKLSPNLFQLTFVYKRKRIRKNPPKIVDESGMALFWGIL